MQTNERPPFAVDFPPSEALDAMLRAFASGNYNKVRTLGRELAASKEEPRVRAAAEEIVSRTNASPIVLQLIGMACVLLVFLSVWWVAFAKAPVGGEPRAPTVKAGALKK